MRPVIDLELEYGLVFDGGGARGAYQIGAWKALAEAGVKIRAVAGTSVGALNGALVCMGDIAHAEEIWAEMKFSRIMDVDDELMDQFFEGEADMNRFVKEFWNKFTEGGVDITPLKELLHREVDEEKIRSCGTELCLVTYSVTDRKAMELSIEEIPEGQLEDFLLASAYLIGFKNEPLHGKTYIDGGVVDNVPANALLNRGYQNIIEVRIFGPGRIPKVTIPEEGCVYTVAPRVSLGSILEFSKKRSLRNIRLGYYDAKRMLYALEGMIYYIEQNHEECYYEKIMEPLSELGKAEHRMTLRLPLKCTDKELFMGMLEAGAKLMRITKYNIYTVDELWDEVVRVYDGLSQETVDDLPKFVHEIVKMRRPDENSAETETVKNSPGPVKTGSGYGIMKAEILKMLRSAESYISGQQLCDKFKVSRTAVWKVINQLKDDGYEIEAVRNKGYRIVDVPDVLNAEVIESYLETDWAGRSIVYSSEIDSTNTRAKMLGESGAVHGTLVASESQNAGKGRRGRQWSSPAGSSIYMTLLLRPEFAPMKAPMLTLVMAYSVAEAVRETENLEIGIKWPNDLVLNKKKICGILTEMSTEPDFINHVVIGVGINVNNETFPEEISMTATSLAKETGKTFNRAELIAAVMKKFEKNYEEFCKTEDLSFMQEKYNEILVNKDREVTVLEPGNEYHAKALGINSTGELQVVKDDGTEVSVFAGEVSVRGIYGYV